MAQLCIVGFSSSVDSPHAAHSVAGDPAGNRMPQRGQKLQGHTQFLPSADDTEGQQGACCQGDRDQHASVVRLIEKHHLA
jgi:hypothetical protein